MMINNHKPNTPLSVICCICKGECTLFTSHGLTAEVPWGKFTVHFHQSCYRPDTKELAEHCLRQLVIENMPKPQEKK